MPTPILITLEEAACAVVLGESLRPETRAAIERGRVGKDEERRPIREAELTIEDLQEVESVLWAFNQTLVQGKDATSAATACYRVLMEARSVLRAVRK